MFWSGTKATEFPVLGIKAAEMRHLIPVLRDITYTFKDLGPCGKQRFLILNYLTRIQKASENKGWALKDEDSEILLESIHKFNAVLKSLQRDAVERFLWNSTIKNHYTWHYGEQSFYINPDIVWCFGFEDFVGKIANISLSYTHGRSSDTIYSAVCAKYLLYISILMREFQEALD